MNEIQMIIIEYNFKRFYNLFKYCDIKNLNKYLNNINTTIFLYCHTPYITVYMLVTKYNILINVLCLYNNTC